MASMKIPFKVGSIIRGHRRKEFNKIDKGKLIDVFWAYNSPKGREEIARMEAHFSGKEFPNSPDVPYVLTLSRHTSQADRTGWQYQIWVEKR